MKRRRLEKKRKQKDDRIAKRTARAVARISKDITKTLTSLKELLDEYADRSWHADLLALVEKASEYAATLQKQRPDLLKQLKKSLVPQVKKVMRRIRKGKVGTSDNVDDAIKSALTIALGEVAAVKSVGELIVQLESLSEADSEKKKRKPKKMSKKKKEEKDSSSTSPKSDQSKAVGKKKNKRRNRKIIKKLWNKKDKSKMDDSDTDSDKEGPQRGNKKNKKRRPFASTGVTSGSNKSLRRSRGKRHNGRKSTNSKVSTSSELAKIADRRERKLMYDPDVAPTTGGISNRAIVPTALSLLPPLFGGGGDGSCDANAFDPFGMSNMQGEAVWVSCPCCTYEYTLVEEELTAQDAQNYCKKLKPPMKKRMKQKDKKETKPSSSTCTDNDADDEMESVPNHLQKPFLASIDSEAANNFVLTLLKTDSIRKRSHGGLKTGGRWEAATMGMGMGMGTSGMTSNGENQYWEGYDWPDHEPGYSGEQRAWIGAMSRGTGLWQWQDGGSFCPVFEYKQTSRDSRDAAGSGSVEKDNVVYKQQRFTNYNNLRTHRCAGDARTCSRKNSDTKSRVALGSSKVVSMSAFDGTWETDVPAD